MKKFIYILIFLTAFLIATATILCIFCNIAYAKTYKYTKSEKDIIARVVFAESRNQPFLGKAAVAQVVINRYENNKGRYSMNYITRRSQFAKASKAKVKRNPKAYKKCMEAVEWAIKNRVLPKNCTSFQRANRAYWGNKKNIKRYCTIENHTFYTRGPAQVVKNSLYIGRDGKLHKR